MKFPNNASVLLSNNYAMSFKANHVFPSSTIRDSRICLPKNRDKSGKLNCSKLILSKYSIWLLMLHWANYICGYGTISGRISFLDEHFPINLIFNVILKHYHSILIIYSIISSNYLIPCFTSTTRIPNLFKIYYY